MSLFLSYLPSSSLTSSLTEQAPPETTVHPTLAQQMENLSSVGESAAQIASTLGVLVSEVNSTLGLAQATSSSAAELPAAEHLSVRA